MQQGRRKHACKQLPVILDFRIVPGKPATDTGAADFFGRLWLGDVDNDDVVYLDVVDRDQVGFAVVAGPRKGIVNFRIQFVLFERMRIGRIGNIV